jgi:hypothetical protein
MKLYKFAEIYCKQAGVVIPFPSKDPNQEKLISALDDYFDEFVRPIVGKAFYDIENGNFPKELVLRYDPENPNKEDMIIGLLFKRIFEKEVGWPGPSEKLLQYLQEQGIDTDIYRRDINFAILELYEKEFEEMVSPV